MEEWRDIPGYEGLYQVSNEGRAKSLEKSYTERNSRKATHTLEERVLKPSKYNKGYLYVTLTKNDKRKIKKIHRLVAEAFIPNPDGLPQVNHKDENKENNFVFINEDGSVDLEKSNLEWCDNKYNSNYGSRGKRIGDKLKGKNRPKYIAEKIAHALSRQVYQYTLDGVLVKIWNSTQECGKNGFHQGAVAACCRKCFNKEGNDIYKGYKWSYEPL